MKKNTLKTWILVLIITLLSLPVEASHEITCPEGTSAGSNCWQCGNDCTAILGSNGTMKIKGNGAMWGYDYYNQKAPWTSYMSQITSLEIDEGITSVGAHSFYGANRMVNLTVADSVETFGYCSFQGATYSNITVGANSSLKNVDSVFYVANVNLYCKGDLQKCEKQKAIYDNMGKQTTLNYYTKYDTNGNPVEIWNEEGGFIYDENGNVVMKYGSNGNFQFSYNHNSDGSIEVFNASGQMIGLQNARHVTPAQAAALTKSKGNTVSITW